MQFQTLIEYRGLKELFNESYEELGGIHYLGYALHDPQDICSSVPLHTIEDFKGLKLQVPGVHAYPFAAAGASCVWYSLSECYMAAKTGIIDAYYSAGAMELIDLGLHEVFPIIVTPPVTNPCNVAYLINEKTWDSLPGDLQAIINYAVRSNNLHNVGIRHAGESEYRGYFQEVSVLDDECVATLKQYSMDSLDEIAAESPRCAKAVQIIRDYKAELAEAGWK